MGKKAFVAMVGAFVCFAAIGGGGRAEGQSLDPARIEELTGLQGTQIEQEGVLKVTAPRADVGG